MELGADYLELKPGVVMGMVGLWAQPGKGDSAANECAAQAPPLTVTKKDARAARDRDCTQPVHRRCAN